jgi:hypothetical protein
VTTLDVADLVVIPGRAVDIEADVALARIDIAAAQAALAEAWASVAWGGRVVYVDGGYALCTDTGRAG